MRPPDQRKTVSYHEYSTVHEDFRLWIDRVMSLIHGSSIVGGATLAILLYIAGLVFAMPFDFEVTYVQTEAVYLGVVGVALVLAFGHSASKRVHPIFETARPIFTITDEGYREVLRRWLSRLADNKAALRVSAALFVLLALLVASVYLTSRHTEHQLHIESLRPPTFPNAWYSSGFRVPAIALLIMYASAIALTLGTAIRILIVNLGFLRTLRKLPVIPLPTLVRVRLRPLTDYYLSISLAWAFGVALFAILFGGKYDVIAATLIVTLLTFGVLTVAVPQFVFHRYVNQSYRDLCDSVLVEFYNRTGAQLIERGELSGSGQLTLPDNLADIVQLTERPKMWIYDTQDIVVWVSAQIVAIGIVLGEHVVFGVT